MRMATLLKMMQAMERERVIDREMIQAMESERVIERVIDKEASWIETQPCT